MMHDDEPLLNAQPNYTVHNLMISEMLKTQWILRYAKKSAELWEKIRTRLAWYCAPYESRFLQRSNQQLAITYIGLCLSRRSSRRLFMLVKDYNSATSMLADATFSFDDDSGESLDDEYVVVRTQKVRPPWGHMTAAFLCYSCIGQVCTMVMALFCFPL